MHEEDLSFCVAGVGDTILLPTLLCYGYGEHRATNLRRSLAEFKEQETLTGDCKVVRSCQACEQS